MPISLKNELPRPNVVSITIITATFNAGHQLPGLITSLRAQTDKDFEWIIADGASSDDTLAVLETAKDLNLVISSQPDFGIYDALNRAVRMARSEYYVVIGADDRFFPEAIHQYKEAVAHSRADIVTATVLMQGQPQTVREGQAWRYGINGFVSAHSVGTLIRKTLHEKFGYYSRRFPIAADHLFVTSACLAGAHRHVANFLAGEFSTGGVSTTDRLGTQLELYRVQMATGQNKYIQTTLLCIWLIKYCLRGPNKIA